MDSGYTSIGSLFADARRCLQMSFEAIKHHCLYRYRSKKSLIRNKYCGLLGNVPRIVAGLAELWGTFEVVIRHAEVILSAGFSPDGTRVVSGSYDGSLRIWNAATGEIGRVLEGDSREVNSVSFSPDGTRVVYQSKFGIQPRGR